jgi:hypothetical protein
MHDAMLEALSHNDTDMRFRVRYFDDDWFEDEDVGIDGGRATVALAAVFQWMQAHRKPHECPAHLRSLLPFTSICVEVCNDG